MESVGFAAPDVDSWTAFCFQVMANLVMEKLLPSLGKDLLPRLKARKTDRKKTWFIVSPIRTFRICFINL